MKRYKGFFNRILSLGPAVSLTVASIPTGALTAYADTTEGIAAESAQAPSTVTVTENDSGIAAAAADTGAAANADANAAANADANAAANADANAGASGETTGEMSGASVDAGSGHAADAGVSEASSGNGGSELHGELEITGRQKGESQSSTFKYAVLYQKGTPSNDSHLRVDTCTNNRPGIILKKSDVSGAPLAGAAFTLKDNLDELIGTFTSDADGMITTAFLRDDVPYTLTETSTPQGYHGLEEPVTITLHDGTVTVGNIAATEYELVQGTGITPTLTIKNRPLSFRVVKIDGDTLDPLSGVKFKLHLQHTIDQTTDFDPNPMPGYEQLVSGSDGVIPLVNETLAKNNTYQLREIQALSRYQNLESHTVFTISPTGKITLGAHPVKNVSLRSEIKADGTFAYTMTVKNFLRPVAPTGLDMGMDAGPYRWMGLFGLLLALPVIFRRRKREEDGDAE